MEEIGLFSEYPIIHLLSYIITVIIGGVGFKFYKEYTSKTIAQKEMASSDNQNLIINLTQRVDSLTEHVQKLEEERREIHKRELERTKELAEAQANVKILTQKVNHLQETIEGLVKENRKYKKIYGTLDD